MTPGETSELAKTNRKGREKYVSFTRVVGLAQLPCEEINKNNNKILSESC